MNEEKRILVKVTPPEEDIASSRASFSKEEYERMLSEWWANYDPGMDAYLLTRAFSTSPESRGDDKDPKVYTSTFCDILEA